MSRERLSILSQIHFLSRSRDPRRTTAFLERVRERFVQRLEEYEALRRREEEATESEADALVGNLALDFGLETLRARVEWCDEAIRRLGALGGGGTSRA